MKLFSQRLHVRKPIDSFETKGECSRKDFVNQPFFSSSHCFLLSQGVNRCFAKVELTSDVQHVYVCYITNRRQVLLVI